MSEEEFNSLYPNAPQTRLSQTGICKWNPHMTFEEAEVLNIRKTQEAANQFIISKGQGGLVEAVGSFGTAILTSFASPINSEWLSSLLADKPIGDASSPKPELWEGGILKGQPPTP